MWSGQLRLVVLLAILPAAATVFCTQCGHAAAPGAHFCGKCGKMLDAVNLLTTFTLLGTSAFLARNAAKNSTPNTTKKRQSLLTPACPSTKKKEATVDRHRPQCPACHRTFANAAGLGNHMNVHKDTRVKRQPAKIKQHRRELSVHRREAGDKNTNKIVAVLPVHVDFIQIR